MTGKRFCYDRALEKVYDDDTYNGETTESYDLFECCGIMNEYVEENKQLRQQNILLMQQVDKLSRYIKELEYDNERQNKQLDIFRDILKKE